MRARHAAARAKAGERDFIISISLLRARAQVTSCKATTMPPAVSAGGRTTASQEGRKDNGTHCSREDGCGVPGQKAAAAAAGGEGVAAADKALCVRVFAKLAATRLSSQPLLPICYVSQRFANEARRTDGGDDDCFHRVADGTTSPAPRRPPKCPGRARA